jgi:hypothetical protein
MLFIPSCLLLKNKYVVFRKNGVHNFHQTLATVSFYTYVHCFGMFSLSSEN